jgi:hypothetical protein
LLELIFTHVKKFYEAGLSDHPGPKIVALLFGVFDSVLTVIATVNIAATKSQNIQLRKKAP